MKKEEEERKNRNIFIQPSFPFIFKIQKREAVFKYGAL
jgi:hypothetical protein